jgi:hypothetical protein
VTLNLEGFVNAIDGGSLRLLSPDDVAVTLRNVQVSGVKIAFTMPELEIYNVVTIN